MEKENEKKEAVDNGVISDEDLCYFIECDSLVGYYNEYQNLLISNCYD